MPANSRPIIRNGVFIHSFTHLFLCSCACRATCAWVGLGVRMCALPASVRLFVCVRVHLCMGHAHGCSFGMSADYAHRNWALVIDEMFSGSEMFGLIIMIYIYALLTWISDVCLSVSVVTLSLAGVMHAKQFEMWRALWQTIILALEILHVMFKYSSVML